MHGDSSRRTAQVSRVLDAAGTDQAQGPAADDGDGNTGNIGNTHSWPDTAGGDPLPRVAWSASTTRAATGTGRLRLAGLARTIECDVIPRLVEAHRPARTTPAALRRVPGLPVADVQAFVQALECSDHARMAHLLSQLRRRGTSIEAIYTELFTPAARQLGEMWCEDTCDFPTVTVAVGHLQRLMRELNPAFNAEQDQAPCGHRILFVQPRDAQHSFGLSMLAEFFRRDGWTVLGGVGGTVGDPAAKVRDEWVDVLGYSVGADRHLDWLMQSIQTARAASRNRKLVVLVGGPLFIVRAELATQVGADGSAADARSASALAERLLLGQPVRK